MEEDKYLQLYQKSLLPYELNMYIFIENDNLSTPMVSLTPIFIKEKFEREKGSVQQLKFPTLEVATQARENVQLWDLVSFSLPVAKSP